MKPTLPNSEPDDAAMASDVMTPTFRAAEALKHLGSPLAPPTLPLLIEALKVSMAADGDASQTLRAQTDVLDALFHKLTNLALSQTQLPSIEGLMRLALKAQSQSMRTAEALASIKTPPKVFAKQLNVGNAVQVNNGGQPEENSQKAPNEVSSEHEPRTEPRAIEENSSMETVGAFHWPQDAERQIARVEERF